MVTFVSYETLRTGLIAKHISPHEIRSTRNIIACAIEKIVIAIIAFAITFWSIS